ncbi:uncharacterized protein METZ01_LOCUS426968 [marine metagenome]|jgi:hypothetical protein|uniref:Uncharacterized protein n=1 Tax=marine metagenome TaxID=408172 RepID=A0A382XT97_9ZZZZ
MKYLLISLVLLFGLSDVAFSQSRFNKLFKEIKKVTQVKSRKSSGRKVVIQHMKSISKVDYMNGKYKKLIVPYEESGKVKSIQSDYKNGRYIRVIQRPRGQSITVNLKSDGATYDYWKNKGWY